MKREMVDAIVRLGEYNRFSKGIFEWIGFNTYWISYENIKRSTGKTKWNFWGLFKYAIDGIICFSQVPLYVASSLGIVMTIVSFLFVIVIALRRIIYGDPVSGWASTVCIIIFLGGVQLFSTGIIGHYLSKTYLETKKRPHYIIKKTNKKAIETIN